MQRTIVVGAEIATAMGIPTLAAFCSILKPQRLVITATPLSGRGGVAMVPISLSWALRPTSSRVKTISAVAVAHTAA
jgi:hypothetical protein